jgi:hypothetical protein
VELGWIPTDWDSVDTQQEIDSACDAFLPQNNSDPVLASTTQQSTLTKQQGKARSAMDVFLDALLTLAVYIGVLVLLLSVAAGAAWALGCLPTSEWFAPSNAYAPIPDKEADNYL